MRTKRQLCLSIVLLLAVAAVLVGCGSKIVVGSGTSETKHVIVADYANARVLIYDAPFSTNQSASIALGQTSLTDNTSGTSSSTINFASAVAVDSDGNIWVGDTHPNCRVSCCQPFDLNPMTSTTEFIAPSPIGFEGPFHGRITYSRGLNSPSNVAISRANYTGCWQRSTGTRLPAKYCLWATRLRTSATKSNDLGLR